MIASPNPLSPDYVGRVSQVIVAALILGLLMFGTLALVLHLHNPNAPSKAPFPIEIIGVGLGIFQIILWFIVPRLISNASIRHITKTPPTDWRVALVPVYLMTTVVASALLEGAGLFNGAAFMAEHHWMNIGMLGVMVLLMAITFPSQIQFESWVEQVQRDNS